MLIVVTILKCVLLLITCTWVLYWWLHGLGSPKFWRRGFDSCSRHWCVSKFFRVVFFSRGAYPLYKQSYQLSVKSNKTSRDFSVSTVIKLRTERPAFYSWWGWGISLFATASRPALGPLTLWSNGYCGLFPSRVKLPGREADHSPSSSAEVKNAWSYISYPPYRDRIWDPPSQLSSRYQGPFSRE
jgi:hypothetical protein